MKMTKTKTSIALVTSLTLGVVLLDAVFGFNGKKNRLVNGLRSSLIGNTEKKDKVETKLNEIADGITSLTKRISKVEESLTKLDGKFEKKLEFPPKLEKEFGGFNGEANLQVFGFESHDMKDKKEELFSPNQKPEESPIGFVSITPSGNDVQKQLNFIHNMEASLGFTADQGYENTKEKSSTKKHHSSGSKRKDRENNSLKKRNNFFKKHNDFNEKSTDFNNKMKEQAKEFPKETAKPHFEEIPLQIINEHIVPSKKNKISNSTHDKEFIPFPLMPFNPLQNNVKAEKMSFPGSNKGTVPIIHADGSKPIDFSEIFPDLSKEDPIVEVKRFDDYDSFRKFGENIKSQESQGEDGAADTKYFKMSEIMNSDKKPAIAEAVKSLTESSEPKSIAKKVKKLDITENSNIPAESAKMESLTDLNKYKEASKYTEEEGSFAKKACEEFNDPEEAYKTGMCVYKDQGKASQLKSEKIAEVSNEVEKLKAEKAKLEEAKAVKIEELKSVKAEEIKAVKAEETKFAKAEETKFAKAEEVKAANIENSELKVMKESEKAKPEMIIVEEIKATVEEKPELQISPDEKFIKDNQIDKNIQTSFGNNEKYDSHSSDISLSKMKSSKIDKAEEEDSLLEMIGTKLSKKVNEKTDESIQQPSTKGPVV